MTIEEVKELKDKVYELEGLLELAQLREEKLEELTPLIQNRLKTLVPGEVIMPEENIEDVTENYDTSVGGIFSQTEEPERAPRCLNDQYAEIRKSINER